MTFNTGNTVGSTDARDLYDNAQNLDKFANGQELEYEDRLGVPRKSLAGIEQDSREALDRLSFQVLGDYQAGIVFENFGQIFRKDGEFYRAAASLDLPYTLTGNWATESVNFVSVGDAVLRQELAGNHGFELVGGAVGYVDNYESLRSYVGPATRLHVAGRATKFDGALGYFAVDSADTTTTDNDGTILVDVGGRRWKRQFTGRVKAAWFGVVAGDLSNDYAPQVQKAVSAGCNSFGGVDFPNGKIRIDATITFPNTGFDLHGASGTATEFVTDVADLVLFDFTACNGPAKTINRIGFGKITPGTYGGITAVKTFNTNGLLLNSVWARGVNIGLDFHGSFINMNQCAFEYCNRGVKCLTACKESAWVATTFYRNETDVELVGDNATFSSSNSNHIGTRVAGWRLIGCNNAAVDQVSFQDDDTGNTPNLIHLSGVSSGNSFDQVKTTGFGLRGIFCDGADVKYNRFTNLTLRNTQVAGNRGIYCSGSSGNYFNGLVNGWEYGVHAVTCSDEFELRIVACSVGQVLSSGGRSIWDVVHEGNTTADAQASNTTSTVLKRYVGDRSGLSSIPYIFKSQGYGAALEVTAVPSALAWNSGDRAINRTPVVGQPKGWICTASGTPGTWVSEGNL